MALEMQQHGLFGIEKISHRLDSKQSLFALNELQRLHRETVIPGEAIRRDGLFEEAAIVELMWIARRGSVEERDEYHSIFWIRGYDPIYTLTSKEKMLAAYRDYIARIADYADRPVWDRGPEPSVPDNPVCRSMVFPLEWKLQRFDQAAASFRLVEVKLADQAYRKQFGRPIDRIGDLSPKFIDSVQDPYSGKSLRLKHNPLSGERVIYSLGADMDDDGGRASKTGIAWDSDADLPKVPVR